MTNPPEWQAPDPSQPPPSDPSGQPSMPPSPPQPENVRPGVIPLRPLGLGEILDGSISTMRRHPAVMIGMAALVSALTVLITVPLQLLLASDLNDMVARAQRGEVVADPAREIVTNSLLVGLVAILVTVLARVFLVGFLTSVVNRAVVGKPVGFSAVWAEVRPVLLRLLGLSLLLPLIFVGLFLPALLSLFASSRALFGLLVLITIPVAVWLYIRFALSTPALVVERTKVIRSLSRSTELVRGSWWRTFGILLLTTLIAFVLALIIGVPFEALAGGFSSPTTLNFEPVTLSYLLVSAIGTIIAGAIVEPFVAGVTALLYFDRRIRSEGLDIELAQSAGIAPPR